eukprot:CAMPEP_0176041626 /NCGR_PEP_ID=MMETSP0120_2-20121206/20648_1 /TAXON_ID=160619 /ORGANISM="Kryptoperidinium foliaceum, Strain CCMP 1326" /LENGTH=607 /DNA_ID=CAMNT_0017375029 /DNA_START=47 /DNA_END=1872 /DNA_ORIENTATION=-
MARSATAHRRAEAVAKTSNALANSNLSYAAQLVGQSLHVDAGGEAFHAQTPLYEHVDVHIGLPPNLLEDLEERGGVVHLNAHCSQMRRDLVVLQVPLELFPCDGARVVVVHGLAEVRQQLLFVALLAPLLDDELVLIQPAHLHGVVDEDTREDIEHGEVEERDEGQEQPAVVPTSGPQQRVESDPVVATCSRHVQRRHRQADGAETLQQTRLFLAKILRGHGSQVLAHQDDEHEPHDRDDAGKHHEAPEERDEGTKNRAQYIPQLPQNPEHAENAHHPAEPQYPQRAQEGQVDHGDVFVGRRPNGNLVEHGQACEHQVQHIPLKVMVPEEEKAVHVQLEPDLHHPDAAEHGLDDLLRLRHRRPQVHDRVVGHVDRPSRVRQDGEAEETVEPESVEEQCTTLAFWLLEDHHALYKIGACGDAIVKNMVELLQLDANQGDAGVPLYTGVVGRRGPHALLQIMWLDERNAGQPPAVRRPRRLSPHLRRGDLQDLVGATSGLAVGTAGRDLSLRVRRGLRGDVAGLDGGDLVPPREVSWTSRWRPAILRGVAAAHLQEPLDVGVVLREVALEVAAEPLLAQVPPLLSRARDVEGRAVRTLEVPDDVWSGCK